MLLAYFGRVILLAFWVLFLKFGFEVLPGHSVVGVVYGKCIEIYRNTGAAQRFLQKNFNIAVEMQKNFKSALISEKNEPKRTDIRLMRCPKTTAVHRPPSTVQLAEKVSPYRTF